MLKRSAERLRGLSDVHESLVEEPSFSILDIDKIRDSRGAGFLFSRNGINVPISRSRRLAHLTCTDVLLDTRARTADGIRLIETLNAFGQRSPERSQP